MRGGKVKKTSKTNMSRSVMGRLLPPVDIQDESQLGELDKRISIGPVLVFVYADWCGHCQRYKPTMEKLESEPGRTIQTARIRDDVYPKSSLNGTPPQGYPTLMLVKKNGEVAKFKDENGEITTAIPNHKDLNQMKVLVRNAGTPEAEQLLETEKVNNSVLKMEPLSPVSGVSTMGTTSIPTTPNTPRSNMPNSIVSDRLSSSTVNQLNSVLVNSSNSLHNGGTAPHQATTASVKDALRLGCSAIGFTIYPGSDAAFDMFEEISSIAEEAKANGLAVVIWSYPRGGDLSKIGETAMDICAYATHIAAMLGAHIIKVKPPTQALENLETIKVYEKLKIPMKK
jgi:thiol-disulfide isomerase/thioredoxin